MMMNTRGRNAKYGTSRVALLFTIIVLFSSTVSIAHGATKDEPNAAKQPRAYKQQRAQVMAASTTTNDRKERMNNRKELKKQKRDDLTPKLILPESQLQKLVPRSVTKVFPICKRYVEKEQRQRSLVKGAESSSSTTPSFNGTDRDDDEERLLRRREGNPLQGTKKFSTSRTSSRPGSVAQQQQGRQKQQRGGGTKNRLQQQRNRRKKQAAKRTTTTNNNSGGGRTGRLKSQNQARQKVNNNNEERGGNNGPHHIGANVKASRTNKTTTTALKNKQQKTRGQVVTRYSYGGGGTKKTSNNMDDDSNDDNMDAEPMLKSRTKKRMKNIKRTRKPDDPPEDTPEEDGSKPTGLGQGYKPNYGYYPKLDSEICVSDDKYPNFMKTDVEFYFSTTINECCRLHYKGSVKDCLDVSMKYAKKDEYKDPQGWGGTGPWGDRPKVEVDASWNQNKGKGKPWQPPPESGRAPGIIVDAWGKPYDSPALQQPSGGWQPGWPGAPGWQGPPPIHHPPPLPSNGAKPSKNWEYNEVASRSSGKSGKSGGGGGGGGGGSTTKRQSGGKNAGKSGKSGAKDDDYYDSIDHTKDDRSWEILHPPHVVGWQPPPPHVAWQAPPVWQKAPPPPVKCNKWGGGGWDKPCTYMPTYVPTYFPTYPQTYEPTTPEPQEISPYPTYGVETYEPTYEPTPADETPEPTTLEPTMMPSYSPTQSPTLPETDKPTALDETFDPTVSPTFAPTISPSFTPTQSPTLPDAFPTNFPTYIITLPPTLTPSLSPTLIPTLSPSVADPDFTYVPTPDSDISIEVVVTTEIPTATPTTETPTIVGTIDATTTIDPEATLMYAWGAPESIGEDIPQDFLVPQDVDELVIDVSAGTDYTLLILADGSARVGGNIFLPEEYQGHFGCGCEIASGPNSLLPIEEVVDLNGDLVPAPDFRKVVAGVESFEGSGQMHSVFIDMDGNVYAAGNNNKGQLCLDDEESRIFPTQIDLPANEIAANAVVGGEFTLILTVSGKVYGCGSNEFGQVGLGNDSSTGGLLDLGLVGVKSISAGRDFSLIQSDDGLFVMGDNTYGQLCLDTGGDAILVPTILASPDDQVSSNSVTSFEAGMESTYILFEDGTVDACGKNDLGQLGDESLVDSFGTEVSINDNIVYVGSSSSSQSAFFITDEALVYGTGLNDRGQLGVGDTDNRNTPVIVDFPSSALVADISASNTHAVAR